jgi:hypothetical protein
MVTTVKSITNEIALIEGLAQNDRQAIETIYKQHYGMVQSLIINNNGTSDDARDIFPGSNDRPLRKV